MARLKSCGQNVALSGLIVFLFALVSLLGPSAFGVTDGGILNFLGPPYSTEDFVEGTANDDVAGAELIVWWNQLEPEEGVYDWSMIDNFLAAWDNPDKLAVIRISTAHEILNRTPAWLFDTYGVRRIFNGAWSSLETGLDGYVLRNGAVRTNDPARVVSRAWSVYGQQAAAGAMDVLSYNPGTTEPSFKYTVQFDYKAIQAGTYRLQARTASGGASHTKELVFTASAGETGSKSVTLEFGPYSDYDLFWVIDGPGALSIDNVNFARVGTSEYDEPILGYPNYFDPVFRAKWEEFVTEIGLRYNDDPRVQGFAVGGWGRWEELTLDLDFTTALVDQWLTYGYTDETYFSHLQWCIDLWQEHLPNKMLHTNTGFVDPSPMAYSTYFWWRAPQNGARNGLYIKHNGLSELSGTWNAESAIIHYVYNRYRHDDRTGLFFETAGRMYDNFMNVSGPPLSMLNRAMIDGVDYLCLYPLDLKVQNIRKYLHYVHEQIGRPLWTSNYCYFGDYSMVNPEYSPASVAYYNVWLGIQEFWVDTQWWTLKPHQTTYTTLNGERCAGTNNNWPNLILNIDERQQYNKMFGCLVGVQYFDGGTDTFDITRWNDVSDTQETVTTITKTNSNTWKWHFFHGSDWVDSPESSGADVVTDVVIESNGDGHEYVRLAEVQFVPAREWTRSVVQASEPDTGHAVLGTATRDFTVSADDAICSVAVKVWTGDDAENGLVGNVYRKIGASYELAATREYAWPADGDWFEVFLPNTQDTATYRIELTNAVGSVGYYTDSGGQLAYRAYAYDTESTPGSVTPNGVQAISSGGSHSEDVEILAPCFGAWLPVEVPSGTADIQVEVARIMPDGTVSSAIQQTGFTGLTGSSSIPFYFEPQPAGGYRFTVESDSGDIEWASRDGGAIAGPMLLQRLIPARERSLVAAKGVLYNWAFDTDASMEGWAADGLKDTAIEGGLLKAYVAAMNSSLTSPAGLAVTARSEQYIGFSIRNTTGAAMARIYWTDGSKAFDGTRSAWIPIVPNDTEIRDYYYPMGTEDAWTGNIDQIRITPVCGMTDTGYFEIESIVIASGFSYDGLDTDGDGLTDEDEETLGTNPYLADSDGDNRSDFFEVNYDGDPGYDPYDPLLNPGGTDLDANNADTDGDGMNDAQEITFGADPLDPLVYFELPVGWVAGALVMLGLGAAMLSVSPTTLTVARGPDGEVIGGTPRLTVSNTGASPLRWRARCDDARVTLSSASYSGDGLPSGQSEPILVGSNALEAFSAKLVIEDLDDESATIPIPLHLSLWDPLFDEFEGSNMVHGGAPCGKET